MSNLVLPSRVTIQLFTSKATASRPLRVQGLVFGVRTFARQKNDYHLAPFFSGADGRVVITHDELDIAAHAELQTGLMDYGWLGDSFAYIEIAHWSPDQIARAIEERRLWGLIGRERERWKSVDDLTTQLRQAPNAHYRPLVAPFKPIRDEWDGTVIDRAYDYVMYPVADA
jgi:hypothetical protein